MYIEKATGKSVIYNGLSSWIPSKRAFSQGLHGHGPLWLSSSRAPLTAPDIFHIGGAAWHSSDPTDSRIKHVSLDYPHKETSAINRHALFTQLNWQPLDARRIYFDGDHIEVADGVVTIINECDRYMYKAFEKMDRNRLLRHPNSHVRAIATVSLLHGCEAAWPLLCDFTSNFDRSGHTPFERFLYSL